MVALLKRNKSSPQLEHLLAGGRLSGRQKERILDRVLDRSAPAQRRVRWAFLLATAGGLATAAAALFALGRGQPAGVQGQLAARGAADPGAPAVELVCLGGSLAGCPIGSTLMFVVRDATAESFLAAVARPQAGGARIWYFAGDNESPRVPVPSSATGGVQPLARGVRLGPEHAPGIYQVEVVLSSAPLSKAVLGAGQAPGVRARRTFSLTVTAAR
jgi:hypothetical protein